jgi:60 kDa SS-A/Ro ribonucleoprotein
MKTHLKIFSRTSAAVTPQSAPIPKTVPNAAGGYAFPVDDWARLDRFLLLGSEGGSYYASERTLTRDNAGSVLRAIASDGERAVARIVAISTAGRAPKNDAALFALALAASAEDIATRRAALAALPKVARTGTHLFQFASLIQGSRGWGRALRRAVASWYLAPPVDRLAYQLAKYRQREGWSHRDLLRLAHPETTEPARAALFDYVCRGTESEALPAFTRGGSGADNRWRGGGGPHPRGQPAARGRADRAAERSGRLDSSAGAYAGHSLAALAGQADCGGRGKTVQ